jgi:XisI protein
MKSKIKKYEKIILALLEEYAAYKPVNVENVENQIIADTVRHHYQLVSIGWQKNTFIHDTVFHFDIKDDGKVWLQTNGTDVDIAAELVERGIAKSDIVLGFHAPRVRPYTGYAAA